MATAVRSDFVNVQLSAAGVAAAKGQLRITAAHLTYVFTPGVPVRVLTSEWNKVLSRERLKGKLIFELAPRAAVAAAAPAVPAPVSVKPAPAVPARAAAADKAKLQTLKEQEAALESQIAKEGN